MTEMQAMAICFFFSIDQYELLPYQDDDIPLE